LTTPRVEMPFPSHEGKNVPSASFVLRKDGQFVNLKSEDIFANKKVVVFGLPGAFTPTCSGSHLPRYDELWPTFKSVGIDAIYCVTVNDAFVCNAWERELQIKNVKLLADGNGDFTEQLELLVSKQEKGFGKRSWRYSMLVENGIIKKQFIEPEKEGDPFENSTAENMLKYLGITEVKFPPNVVIFTKEDCPFCFKAKKLLSEHNINFDEIPVGQGSTHPQRIVSAITGSRTVPKIYWNGHLIGGCDELEKFFKDNYTR